MKKGISYDEKELKENFERLKHYLNEISNFYGLIFEQLNGDRNNIKASMVRRDYEELEKLSEVLNEFEIGDVKVKSLDSVLKEFEEFRNNSEIY